MKIIYILYWYTRTRSFQEIMRGVTYGSNKLQDDTLPEINTADIARPNKSNGADCIRCLIYCHTEQGSLIAKNAYHQLGHPMKLEWSGQG
jgi:hypothetical protein